MTHFSQSVDPMPLPPDGLPVEGARDPALNADKSPVPLYHRVYVLLRERIINGIYRPGDKLPSEPALMHAFGVSRITIKRALNDLAAQGLLERSRGRGTTVTQAGAQLRMNPPITASIDGLLANLSAVGKGTSVDVVAFEYVRASPDVASHLQLPEGTLVQHAARVRHLGQRPYAHSTSFLPEALGRTFSRDALKAKPLIDLIRQAGVRVGQVDQTITSTLADHDMARYLDVDVGSPLLKLCRVFFDTEKRAINYAEIRYAPDRFTYRMTWTLGRGDELQLDAQHYRSR